MILDEIVNHKKEIFQEITAKHPVEELIKVLKGKIITTRPAREFQSAFSGGGTRIIAEIKKASPSRGVIREEFDPPSIARSYEDNGAAAISVLSDRRYFHGDINHISAVKAEVGLPVLRKDFLTEELDVYESRAAGADCILLIARILEQDALGRLFGLSNDLGMDSLIEVHDEDDLEKILPLNPKIIGINNRDLDTLKVDITTTLRLIREIPDGKIVISESGISSHEDIALLRDAGVAGFLIGEALMTSEDTGKRLRELRGME